MKFCRTNDKCSKFRVKRKQTYSQEMTEFLHENFNGANYNELTKLFNAKFKVNKKIGVIKAHCLQSGLEKNTHVTDEIAEFLRANYSDISNDELTRRFNTEFNLNKTVSNIKSYCFKYGLKKDPLPALPIGSECFRTSAGMTYVKVDDKKWIGKHRLLWEERNGPIPSGYNIIFADGNTNNFDIENLTLISRSEYMFMKKAGLLLNNKELTKIGLVIAKIKLKIKDYSKK